MQPETSTHAALPQLFARAVASLPTRATDALSRWPFLVLCLRVTVWLAAFFVLDQFMVVVMKLGPAGYAQPSLLLATAGRLGVAGCALLLGLAALLLRFGLLRSAWSALEHGAQLRVLVVFLAVMVAWPLTTMGYNYYFDQGYYLDRLLIVALLPLLWFRPLFIFPFLLLCFAMLWQLSVPPLNSGSHIPHKLQLLHVLNLFGAMFLLHAVSGYRRSEGFFFMTCCLVAAAYWQPAMTKLSIGWLGHGGLFHMPLAAYAHGWLSFLDKQVLLDFSGLLRHFDWPMRLFVITIEAATLIFLMRRWLSITLLLCLILFHLAVFSLYGYLFWTWIVLDAALLAILVRDRHRNEIRIFTPGHLLLSAALIYLAPYWCNPPTLGWFDTRLSYTFRYEVTGASGTTYDVPLGYFTPYEDVFTMANFSYLIDEHLCLVAPYGITGNPRRAQGLMNVTTPEQVFALENEEGADRYDPDRAVVFYAFIERYMSNRNRGERDPAFLGWLRPPRQFWSFPRGNPYMGSEPVRDITVKEVTTLFDNTDLIEIRETQLNRIAIPVQ